ncbi:MAG: fumarylacetoacetate hydrolase family protein [Anderseniella sp.]|jgi:fumarylpyruvate hydrolase|nr:fumarylacetoacetate hydrolase family protein [Anderseniella sp.]
MRYAITPPERTHLAVRGSDEIFPVRRVYCVGRNYAAHAIEMGHDPDREDPFFFLKCPENIVTGGGDFPYPPASSDVHHEIETVVALASGGRDIAVEDALSHVFGYGVGLDMTRRDLQGEMKKLGRPWEIGKAFDHSAPMSELVRAAEIGHPASGAIWLKVNGEVRQSGDMNQMIWKVPEMIAYLSRLFELAPGDLIMTGTPSGVGPVVRGDVMHGFAEGIGEVHCKVA